MLVLLCPERSLITYLPRAKVKSCGRALVPQPGATRSMHPKLRGLGSPYPSLPPPSAPPFQSDQEPAAVPGKLIPEPGGSETTSQAGTLWVRDWRKAVTGGLWASREPHGGGRLLFIPPLSTHPTRAPSCRGSLHVVPTQITPHPYPHPGTYSTRPQPSSPLPLLGRTWRFISLPLGE